DVTVSLEAFAHWGTRRFGELWADDIESFSGARPSDEAIAWWAKKARNACTPDVAVALERVWWQTDLRGVLASVRTPVLLMLEEGEPEFRALVDHLASLFPDARVETFPQLGWMSAGVAPEAVHRPRLDAIARFIGLQPRPTVPDTILSTILFTDIVDSTHHQA